MKLIKQVRLEFRQGTSDKVYEVDLCEVGPGQYVVNFRYGRRGTNLRDGSKTPAPVTQAKADSVFNQLVASERREGYVDVGTKPQPTAAPPSSASPTPTPAPANAAGRDQAILARLREGFTPAKGKKAWRLSRAIWRAGELGLRDAEPLLLDLLQQTRQKKVERLRKPKGSQIDASEVSEHLGDRTLCLPPASQRWSSADWSASFTPPEDMLLYCLAWSLGRCGSAASVTALAGLGSETWQPVVRMATAALLLLLEGSERAQLIEGLTAELPPPLDNLCRSGPPEALQAALKEYLARPDNEATEVLDCLYMIDNPNVRPALLELLRTVPLQSTYFQSVRHIFKFAELRRDAEVFGLLAHRFETAAKETAPFRAVVDVHRIQGGKVSQAKSVVYPFTRPSTRLYFRLRVWRTLRRLGELADPDYVKMTVGVLLPFTDADARDPETWVQWDYSSRRWERGRSGSKRRHRDRFGRYWAFNQVLYRNSPRYEPELRKGFFSCRTSSKPGDKPPPVREEAFPDLWQAAPEALLRLLAESGCELVHEFAVKALKACPDFCRRLDVPALVKLLETPYAVTIEFGLELAVQRYDPNRPDNSLVLALANSNLDRARLQARQWIDRARAQFAQDQAFLAALAGSRHADTRTYARDWLRQTSFSPTAAEALIARLIALLRSFTAEEGERARDTAQTLQIAFATPLRRVGIDVIRDLLEHPLAEVRQFAGELVLAHETLAHRPPEDVLLKLLRDSAPTVRSVGVRLLGQLPEEILKRDIDILVGLVRHEMADFRENIRPVLRRLAAGDAAFGRRIAERLVEALLTPGAPEGVPSHTARVLREDLRAYLDQVAPATVWKLLQSRSPPAQEVGGVLLATNVRSEDLQLTEIVKLTNHDILTVREAAWQMCRDSLARLKADPDVIPRLVDARWQDSRQFAFGLLRDAFGPGELTPAVLVSLCDSVRPDVQAFGREMITRLFAEQDGPDYAIKLSEHPSPSMQMFVANFLEAYIGTNAGHLRELGWYFQSVLSRVNQGRVAKERVFGFLEKVAESGEECAVVVAEILGRQSATAAIGDRARAVQILTRIHAAYPGVAMPLRVKPVEVRQGVS